MSIKGSIRDMTNSKFYEGRTARVIINILLSALIAVSGGLITRFSSVGLTILMICLCVIGIIFQIVYASTLSTVDKKREIAIAESTKQLESYQLLFEELSQNLQDCSVGINKIARSIINKGEAQEDRWTFDNNSNELCDIIRKLIISQSKYGDNISINYVKRHDENENIIELVGCSNTIHEPPDSYRVPKNINDDDAYRDAQMIKKGSSHAEIKLNVDEVDSFLVYKDKEHDSGKREQIAYVPIMCEKKRMVGLLEIEALKGTRIAETREEMEKIVLKTRILYTALLLLQKTEKAALAIPKPEAKIGQKTNEGNGKNEESKEKE